MKTLSGLVLRVFVVLAALAVYGPGVDAQSPPTWPTPVVAPTPTPSPIPVKPTPDPSPTPTASPAPIEPTPESSPTPTETATPATPPEAAAAPPEDAQVQEEDDGDTGSEGTESAAEQTTDDTPKSEQVTNPGDVAFTDYAPFDLDEIEPEPMKSKWGNFVNGLRGIARYNLFDGKVKFRIGGRLQVDGTAGKGNEKYEEFYAPIDSRLDVRRLRIFAAGRINKFNFMVSF